MSTELVRCKVKRTLEMPGRIAGAGEHVLLPPHLVDPLVKAGYVVPMVGATVMPPPTDA